MRGTVRTRFLTRIALACLALIIVIIALYLNSRVLPLTEKQQVLVGEALEFLFKIHQNENRIYSKNGEDGVLEYLFDNIRTINKYYVEIGSENGSECNTRLLWDKHRWNGLLIDGTHESTFDSRVIHRHLVFESNVAELFKQYRVPKLFDLLSIDIDSQDFFVLNAILRANYRPRIIVVEINRNFDSIDSYAVSRDRVVWDGASRNESRAIFGFSSLAGTYLCNKYGYHAVYMDANGINMFCVLRKTLLELVQARTGIKIKREKQLLPFLPEYTYWWTKHGPLHVDSLEIFKNELLRKPYWMRVTEDGEAVKI